MEAQPCVRKGWEFIGHYKVSSTRRLQNFPLISGRSAVAGGTVWSTPRGGHNKRKKRRLKNLMLGRIPAPMDATGAMGTSQSDRKWNGLSEKCQWEMIGL